MTGFRLAFAVAVGLVGLSATTGVAAASSTGGWSYVLSSATGSVAWQYSGPSGSGNESMTFRGRARRGTLHGQATYVDQNTRGCGPVTHTRIANFRRPSFSVEGAYVVVTWSLPLPHQSYCNDPVATSAAQPQVTLISQTIPLSRFTCAAVSLRLVGEATIPEGRATGTLNYQTTVVLRRFLAISI